MTDKYKVVFFGTPAFAANSLNALAELDQIEIALVITQPDRPAGRGGKIQCSEVKSAAEKLNIPVYQPESLKKQLEQCTEHINKFGPFDIGVVIAFGQILPQTILDIPKKGCVNVHASLLPRWRGAAPIQRAVINGDSETGICLMQMDAGLDTGPVYSKSILEISQTDTFQTLHDKLAELGARLLKDDLLKIIKSEINAVSQSTEGVTYAAKITQSDAKINWDRPAAELELLIRGLNPFPAAYCMFQGKRLKIYKACAKENISNQLRPGSIYFTDKSRLEVSCKEGVLLIEELQLEGKKRMLVSEFLNGVKITTDMQLE